MSDNTGIHIYIRQRPIAPQDGPQVEKSLILDEDKRYVTVAGSISTMADRVYGHHSRQEDIWDGSKWIIAEVLKGYNGMIFAYGGTGSGKTYTMDGTLSQPGVMRLAVNAIFDAPSHLEVEVSVSYVEVYFNKVYDLLAPNRNLLEIKRSGKIDVVPGMTIIQVDGPKDFGQLYGIASRERKTASTKLNDSSSRSHAVLMLHLTIHDTLTGKRYQSKLKAVDLAGSEDNNLIGNSGVTLRESNAINTTLFHLSQVLHAINGGNQDIAYLYRSSNIVRLLSDTFGGSSIGIMICCVVAGVKYHKATQKTLKFANDSRGARNKPASAMSLPALNMIAPATSTIEPEYSLQTRLRPLDRMRADVTTLPLLSVARARLRHATCLAQSPRSFLDDDEQEVEEIYNRYKDRPELIGKVMNCFKRKLGESASDVDQADAIVYGMSRMSVKSLVSGHSSNPPIRTALGNITSRAANVPPPQRSAPALKNRAAAPIRSSAIINLPSTSIIPRFENLGSQGTFGNGVAFEPFPKRQKVVAAPTALRRTRWR